MEVCAAKVAVRREVDVEWRRGDYIAQYCCRCHTRNELRQMEVCAAKVAARRM